MPVGVKPTPVPTPGPTPNPNDANRPVSTPTPGYPYNSSIGMARPGVVAPSSVRPTAPPPGVFGSSGGRWPYDPQLASLIALMGRDVRPMDYVTPRYDSVYRRNDPGQAIDMLARGSGEPNGEYIPGYGVPAFNPPAVVNRTPPPAGIFGSSMATPPQQSQGSLYREGLINTRQPYVNSGVIVNTGNDIVPPIGSGGGNVGVTRGGGQGDRRISFQTRLAQMLANDMARYNLGNTMSSGDGTGIGGVGVAGDATGMGNNAVAERNRSTFQQRINAMRRNQ
jgi:hypothetical protein